MGRWPTTTETPQAGGFLRRSHPPPPTQVARLRALLLEATRGRANAVREGLAAIGSWQNLALLMNGPWFAPGPQGPASRRALERRLRLLATRPVSLATAGTLPWGQAVAVHGKARRIPGNKRRSYIWLNREEEERNVRLVVEEGHDFFLEDQPDAAPALVLAAGGHLLSGGRVDDGDRVAVLGFVDRVPDPRVAFPYPVGVRAPIGRDPPRCLTLRSGDELTLVLRKLSEPARSDPSP